MFHDRRDAGRRLASALTPLAEQAPIVIALPRGGVPVADEVAHALDAPLDVLVVRKIGAPGNPEFAIGAVGEGGVRVLHDQALRALHLTDAALTDRIAVEEHEIERRIAAYRHGRPMHSVDGRVVIVVDDGLATGATMAAGVAILRHLGARRIIAAVPTGSAEAVAALRERADEVICLEQPLYFGSVGAQYEDFSQTTDAEVVAILASRARHMPPHDEPVPIPIGAGRSLDGHLVIPAGARGLVLFAHGSGSSRLSPRNIAVAGALHAADLGTLLFDLLTDEESADRRKVFDIELLATRLRTARTWVRMRSDLDRLPLGYFGASTGAAAALTAAAGDPTIRAVVSRGGRPDLAASHLANVTAPTLLIVGGLDDLVLELNRQAMGRMRCDTSLEVVPGASHLFEEPGAMEEVERLAAAWFSAWLVADGNDPGSHPSPASHRVG